MARSKYGAPARVLFLLTVSAAYALYDVMARGGLNSTALTVAGAQLQAADFILATSAFLLRTTLAVLPRGMFIGVIYVMYTKRGDLKMRSWVTLVLLLFASVIGWALHTSLVVNQSEGVVAQRVPEQALVGAVHSGEAIVTKDGRPIVLPDPTKPEGSAVEQGWRMNLANSMTDAIRRGQEQVVIIFSREGCPWCDRQLPVIHEAIASRAQHVAAFNRAIESPKGGIDVSDSNGEAVTSAPVQPGNLLHAPLRAFVLDAGEFPSLAQRFQIQAFPTSIFFGVPGANPRIAQGFLNDEELDKILQAQAVAEVAVAPAAALEEGRARRARRRKRRALFR